MAIRAVGVAGAESLDRGAALDTSLTAARLALAGSIHADASDTTRALFGSAGVSLTQFTPQALLSASGRLQQLDASERWHDRETCELYTLVELPRSDARVIMADMLLGSLVAWAGRRAVPYEYRLEAYEQARSLAARAGEQGIPFAALANGADLLELDAVFTRAGSVDQLTRSRIEEIETGLESEAQSTRDSAYAELLALVARTEFNREFDSGAEVIYEFAVHAAEARGELCDAKAFAQTLLHETALDHWRRVADEILSHIDAPAQECP